jgi:arylsulfatase A-like enzyme
MLGRMIWGPRTADAWFSLLRDFELRSRTEPLQDRRRAAEVIDDFLRWEESSRAPFFAFVNLYDAHDPYDPIRRFRARFAREPNPQDNYDAGIRYMDDQLNRLLHVLQDRGVLDRTLVIVTSDHGEQWGEHGLKNHGNSLYLPLVHVPLVMRLPSRISAGSRVREPVSLTDMAATILDITGVKAPAIPGWTLLGPGRTPVVTEVEGLDPSSRVPSPAVHGAMAAIVSDSVQFIRVGDGTYQLFNVRNDQAQEVNLVATLSGCLRAVELDSLLRRVSREPATPAFGRNRCAVALP